MVTGKKREDISTHSLTRRLTISLCCRQLILDISTHSLTRRLTLVFLTRDMLRIFQLTASRGGWPMGICYSSIFLAFQLTASRGGWRCRLRALWTDSSYFNSQPHEEADGIKRCSPTKKRYFNSQPHEEADSGAYEAEIDEVISTHSLTRRLTEEHKTFMYSRTISTHSLTRRLTAV